MELIHNRDNYSQWEPQAGIPSFRLHPRKRRRKTTRDQRRDCKMGASCGRPPVLDIDQRQILVDFVTGPKTARRMSYKEPAQEFFY